MKPLGSHHVWFVAGSQHLYGDSAIEQVDVHAREVAAALNAAAVIPVTVLHKPTVTTPDSILELMQQANSDPDCVGVIAWMHTFSPAKMWIAGLTALQRPLLHLHTQFNRDLPWAEIDMDFMNLNQSAHGDREFGYIESRMGVRRKTVVGHWSEPLVLDRIAAWSRAACGWRELHGLRVARIGDNMRQVAVTEGDKVEAQVQLGVAVNGYGVGELAQAVADAHDAAVAELAAEYEQVYDVAAELRKGAARHAALLDAARIEVGLRAFLRDRGAMAFTDTFEDLGALRQLPGIAVQRLMADGYGFGAEGDWKTAALLRAMKVMSTGLPGGTSFMEDYTYHLGPSGPKVLGAHMLELCPSIAASRPTCEVHPLSIGGREDPVRLVFTAPAGPAIVVALLGLRGRFRLLTSEVDVVAPEQELAKLPVARAVWEPRPDLATAAEAWLLAGGPHHASFSQALTVEPLADFAEIAGLELLSIDERTRAADFKKELRWNHAYYHLAQGL